MENIEKNYTVRNICSLSDSQATIKVVDSFQINSKLYWNCHQSLLYLAEHKRIQLVWVPGHMGIDRNEITYHLGRQGSLFLYMVLNNSNFQHTRYSRAWQLCHVESANPSQYSLTAVVLRSAIRGTLVLVQSSLYV
jgi:hypothetical protein